MFSPRKLVIQRIGDVIERSFCGAVQLKPYGSYQTGLLTPFSDVDLAISGADVYETGRANEILRLVRDNLGMCGFVTSQTLIENAAVPVLKFEADPSVAYYDQETFPHSIKVKVDLIVDIVDGINPINIAMRTTEYILNARTWYRSFFQNVLVLKYIANNHKLTNTYTGKLTRRPQLPGPGPPL
jgi:DNA polymerase sigma